MRHRSRVVLGALAPLLVGTLLSGCLLAPFLPDGEEATPASPTASSLTAVGTVAGEGAFAVGHLGVTFDLPDGFVEDPSDVDDFLARRTDPAGLVTIQAHEVPDGDYPARPGEIVSTVTIDGVSVTVIENSGMSGLPAGVEANALIARNGKRSFSLIMSTRAAELPSDWAVLMDSLTLDPVD